MMTDKEKFEAWYDNDLDVPLPIDYKIIGKNYLWMGWQASQKAQAKRIAQLEAQLRGDFLDNNVNILSKAIEAYKFECMGEKLENCQEWNALKRVFTNIQDMLEAVSTESVVQRITLAELNSSLATANQYWHNLKTENDALSLQVAQLREASE